MGTLAEEVRTRRAVVGEGSVVGQQGEGRGAPPCPAICEACWVRVWLQVRGGYGEYYTEYYGGPGEMVDMSGGGMMDMPGMMMYGYDPSYCLEGEEA